MRHTLNDYNYLNVDKLDQTYREGLADEREAIHNPSCDIACLPVKSHTSRRRERYCIRCGSDNPRKRQHRIGEDSEIQKAYDNGRFSAYREHYAPLFAGVSCFSGHLPVSISTSASKIRLSTCVRCKGGISYSTPDGSFDEDQHYKNVRNLAPNLLQPFTNAVCMECGTEGRSGYTCRSCGNTEQDYANVKAAFLRR